MHYVDDDVILMLANWVETPSVETEVFGQMAADLGIPAATITPELIRLIRHTVERTEHSIITMEDVGMTWVHTRPCQCLVGSVITPENQGLIVTHCLREHHLIPSCAMVSSMYEYRLYHARYPTMPELNQFRLNSNEMMVNAEAYWSRTKAEVPTPNAHALPIERNTDGETICALCQDAIMPGNRVYRMPCCNGKFHVDADQCLETNTIQTWLARSRRCPGCNQEVIIEQKQEETKEENEKKGRKRGR